MATETLGFGVVSIKANTSSDKDEYGFTADERSRIDTEYLFGLRPCPPWLEERRREVLTEMRREKRAQQWARLKKFLGFK